MTSPYHTDIVFRKSSGLNIFGNSIEINHPLNNTKVKEVLSDQGFSCMNCNRPDHHKLWNQAYLNSNQICYHNFNYAIH